MIFKVTVGQALLAITTYSQTLTLTKSAEQFSLIFFGTRSNSEDYDRSKYDYDKNRISATQLTIPDALKAKTEGDLILNSLFNNNITRFIHNGYKPVIYGSFDNDDLSKDDIGERQKVNIANGLIILSGPGGDVVHGDIYNDSLYGGTGSDYVFGNDGNDTIYGGDGDDLLNGGANNDTIYGDKDSDTIDGGGNDDVLNGGDGDDNIDGGTGNDLLYGNDGSDTLYGGTGSNTLYGGAHHDFLGGGDNNDLLYGGTESDTLYGGSENDFVYGGTGSDLLYGGDGADRFLTAESDPSGSDTIYADLKDRIEIYGDANDKLLINGQLITTITQQEDGINIDNQGNKWSGGFATLVVNDSLILSGALAYGFWGIDYIERPRPSGGSGTPDTFNGTEPRWVTPPAPATPYFDPGNDSHTGGPGPSTLYGRGGNDTLYGGGGNDRIEGNGDNDFLYGDSGNDSLLTGGGYNVAYGGAGDDTFAINFPEPSGRNTLYGGDGWDSFNFDWLTPATEIFSAFGGNGYDTAKLYNAGGMTIDLSRQELVYNGIGKNVIKDIEKFVLSAGDNNTITYISQSGLVDNLTNASGGNRVNLTADFKDGSDYVNFTNSSNIGNQSLVKASSGSDIIVADAFSLVIEGNAGNDLIYGNSPSAISFSPASTLLGGEGDDAIKSSYGTALIDGGGGRDTINGGTNASTIDGGLDSDIIYAGSQNDLIYWQDGADTIYGGGGNDSVIAQLSIVQMAEVALTSGGIVTWLANHGVILNSIEFINGEAVDMVIGGTGNDDLTGTSAQEKIYGGNGDDTLTGGAGDTLVGGEGKDLFIIQASAVIADDDGDQGGISVTLVGQFAEDLPVISQISLDGGAAFALNTLPVTQTGTAGADTLYGVIGAKDVLSGLDGDDLMVGYDGADTLIGGTGSDTLDGGDGVDLADYSGLGAAVRVDLVAGTDISGTATDLLTGIEQIRGAASAADTITGSSADETLRGGGGSGSNADSILGGGGNDVIDGEAGPDSIDGGAGSDSLNGGAGNDFLYYTSTTNGVAIDLINGLVADGGDVDTITGFERIVGGLFADTITGSTGNDTLYGGGGSDVITDTSGINRIWGEAGADTITGSSANNETLYGGGDNDWVFNDASADSLNGGTGNDMLDYSLRDGGITVSLQTGVNIDGDTITGFERVTGTSFADSIEGSNNNETLYGGLGDDTVRGLDGNDSLYGGSGNDILSDTGGTNRIWGDAGSDILYGGIGADSLYGGTSSDTLYGGDGDDWLEGGGSPDALYGGLGADKFRMIGTSLSSDTVYDFVLGDGDRVVLAAGTTYTVTDLGNDIKITANSNNITLIGVTDFDSAIVEFA